MKSIFSPTSAATVGIVFGVLSNYSILRGSWVNLIVWSLVGILIGFFIENKKYVPLSGIFYGLFLTASFLISGFQGSTDKIFGFSILCIVLGAFGAACGFCLVYGAHWLKKKILN
jgi:hypothetical protein